VYDWEKFASGSGVGTETDPTVPDWAKHPNKPTYTAQEVGALPASTVIPTVPTNLSEFNNDVGYLTESDKPDIVAMVIEALGGNPVFGYVDEDNNIIVSGNLPGGTYSVKYEMEDGSTVNIGNLVLDSNVYYSVTNTLTQCTTNNSATKAVQGGSYSATITAKSGYGLKSIVVKMGGTDISSTAVSGGKVTIANVTGNIVITAVADVETPAYTNFADPASEDWKEGYRLSGDINGTTALTGGVVTNYVSVQTGDILEVSGIDFADSNSRQAFWFNSSNNAILKIDGFAGSPSFTDTSYDANSLICTVAADCDSDARMRFSGLATGTSADVVIKIKRNGSYV
jgi:hypothetical protein